MKRLFLILLLPLVAVLSACGSAPEAPPVAPVAISTGTLNTLLEKAMELEVKKLEARNTALLGLIKFADESKSEFAKGAVAGMMQTMVNGGGAVGGDSMAGNPVQSLVRTQMEQQRMSYDYSLRNKELDQRVGPLAWLREGTQALATVGSLTMGYNLQKQSMAYDYNKFGLTLGAIDGMADRGFGAVSESWKYLSERPFFTPPAGSTATFP